MNGGGDVSIEFCCVAPMSEEGYNPIVDVVRDRHLSQLLRQVRVPHRVERFAKVQCNEVYILTLNQQLSKARS